MIFVVCVAAIKDKLMLSDRKNVYINKIYYYHPLVIRVLI